MSAPTWSLSTLTAGSGLLISRNLLLPQTAPRTIGDTPAGEFSRTGSHETDTWHKCYNFVFCLESTSPSLTTVNSSRVELLRTAWLSSTTSTRMESTGTMLLATTRSLGCVKRASLWSTMCASQIPTLVFDCLVKWSITLSVMNMLKQWYLIKDKLFSNVKMLINKINLYFNNEFLRLHIPFTKTKQPIVERKKIRDQEHQILSAWQALKFYWIINFDLVLSTNPNFSSSNGSSLPSWETIGIAGIWATIITVCWVAGTTGAKGANTPAVLSSFKDGIALATASLLAGTREPWADLRPDSS